MRFHVWASAGAGSMLALNCEHGARRAGRVAGWCGEAYGLHVLARPLSPLQPTPPWCSPNSGG